MLIWDNDAIEFYYDQLVPNQHYVPVNKDNVVERVRELLSNPGRLRELADAAKSVTDHFLSGKGLAQYWHQLLSAYSSLQLFSSVPTFRHDDLCTCGTNDEDDDEGDGVDGLPEVMRRCLFCSQIMDRLYKDLESLLGGMPSLEKLHESLLRVYPQRRVPANLTEDEVGREVARVIDDFVQHYGKQTDAKWRTDGIFD